MGKYIGFTLNPSHADDYISNAENWRKIRKKEVSNGILLNADVNILTDNSFKVTAISGGINIGDGSIMIEGASYDVVNAETAENVMIDTDGTYRIVFEFNDVLGMIYSKTVPIATALTRTAHVYQMQLATVTKLGITYTIVDTRTDREVCGYANRIVGDNALALKADKIYTDTQLALKASTVYVDSKVSTALSGTPKGAYATLALLQTAHATDDGNIYVVTANGHIYDWAGTAWADTGILYQGIAIADLSVTESNLAQTVKNRLYSGKMTLIISYGAIPLDFNFTDRKIYIPANCFLQFDRTLIQNVPTNTTTTKVGYAYEVPMPSTSLDGIVSLFYDVTLKKYICSHYLTYNADLGVDSNLLLLASWRQYPSAGALLGFVISPSIVKVNGAYQATFTPVIPTLPTYSEVNNRLLLPPKMFFVDGEILPLYKSNIFASTNAEELFKVALVNISANNIPKFQYFYEDILLESDELQNTFALGVKQKTDSNYNYTKNITKSVVTVANNAGKTPRIINIGDSLTNRNIPEYLKAKLISYGVTPTMQGTMDNFVDVKGEGREGWEFENFIGADNTYSGGGVITRQTTVGAGSLTTNPFLKLADATDKANHPDWCFRNTGIELELSYTTDTIKTGNFYIFDFAYYLATQGFVTPDVVTIALSTNDINQDGVTSLSHSRLGLEIMIKQIKLACPSCKIGIIPCPSWGSNAAGNTWWNTYVATWLESCMTDVLSYQATITGLDIVPIWCHLNRDFNFPYDTSVALSSVNQTQKSHRAEFIHWGETGKVEYINALSAYIMNVI